MRGRAGFCSGFFGTTEADHLKRTVETEVRQAFWASFMEGKLEKREGKDFQAEGKDVQRLEEWDACRYAFITLSILVAHEPVFSRDHAFCPPSARRCACFSVPSASVSQGPPKARHLVAHLSITCGSVIPTPGGPGPLNQNLKRVRVGWRDTKFQFQVWQSLDEGKVFDGSPTPTTSCPV